MFRDRSDAGRQLAEELAARQLHAPVVLALPRGGVPVAFEVARRLAAPLDVLVARKVGAPFQPELGIGAIAEGDGVVVDEATLRMLGVSREDFDARADAERDELARRVRRYRGDRPMVEIGGRDVVLVDDGLATGVTAEAALRAVRAQGPRSVTLAVPVAAADTARRLAGVADDVVYVAAPEQFQAVGRWYDVFDQTSDEEVLDLLARAGPEATPETPMLVEEAVQIPQEGDAVVHADLTVPEGARGIVVFAHGSGSSRRSGRNRLVAANLQLDGLATLLLDLLTPDEEIVDLRTRHLRFDIGLLARRLEGAIRFVRGTPAVADLPIGCFGASTGAAAALVAAARLPDEVRAVVSRGGRPDLAGDALPAVRAPTLLIVGGDDTEVLQLNREAAAELRAAHRVEVIPGATHLFEEPGTLERAADLAGAWFLEHLRSGVGARRGTG